MGKSAAPGEILKERDERASGRRPQRVTPQKNPTYELCPAAGGEPGNRGHGRVALTRWRRLRRGRVGCAADAGPGGSGNGGEVPGGKGAFWGEKGPKRVGPCRAGPTTCRADVPCREDEEGAGSALPLLRVVPAVQDRHHP